jgi:hypothetical protein
MLNNLTNIGLLDKKILRVWLASGTDNYPHKHIVSDELLLLRLAFYGGEVFYLYADPNQLNTVLIDWDCLCDFEYYEDNHLFMCGGVEMIYWTFIQQLLLKIENSLNVAIDLRWWDIVNRMKEIYEELE